MDYRATTYALICLVGVLAVQGRVAPQPSAGGSEQALEDRLREQLAASERRIMKHLQEKVQHVNQSVELAYLERLYFIVYEELELAKDKEKQQTADIDRLETTVQEQKEEVRNLRITLDDLRSVVSELSGTVRQLQSQTGDNPGPVTPHLPPTPRPTPKFDPLHPTDCQDVYLQGGTKYDGDYYIMIQPYLTMEPFKVCCRVENQTGWTMIQRRRDGSVSFYRTWDEYKRGFGHLENEFWLGNDHIYQLTNQRDYRLRIDMTDWDGNDYHAEYDHFRISNEADKYRLHVHGYHGNAGDSLTSHWENHNNQPFSTKDQDNDDRFYDNCADHFRGAWWFKNCFESHLNGIYYHKGSHSNYFVRNGIQWNGIHLHSSLKSVAMMIRPNEDISESRPQPEADRWMNGIH